MYWFRTCVFGNCCRITRLSSPGQGSLSRTPAPIRLACRHVAPWRKDANLFSERCKTHYLPTRTDELISKLATFRDPRSYFTFLNYLKCKNRLEAFTNLGTFLPLREEFNDYLTWAAGHFTDQVQYGAEVTSVAPAEANHNIVGSWHVTFQDRDSGHTSTVTAQHVVIALGGTPRLPRSLEQVGPRVVHSSQYLSAVSTLLPRLDPADTRLAVIGGGQSAAEIFDDLTSRYREANITLFTTASALRPSDDSPLYVVISCQFYFFPDIFRGLTASFCFDFKCLIH